MSVVYKPFIIFDIEEIKKAELKILGKVVHSKPDLDMYRIKAILKSYIEKTKKGFEILEKLGHGDKLDKLNLQYLEQQDAFTAYVPVTHKTLNWNKYKVGSEIMIAYYPTNVWASFHIENEPDNNDDKERVTGGEKS